MEKKSSGGGQGSGGEQKKPPAKPAAAGQKPAVFEGAGANPRATLNGVAAVVMSTSNAAKKEPEVDPKKVLNANVFSSSGTVAERKRTLPSVWTGSQPDTEEEEAAAPTYDGITPAEELTSRDLWKAIKPPVQSREGQRSAQLYEQVINQFAVGHNPRYAPDGPEKPRAHIFVWDVTRAMNAEIPHMVGARELTLAQTLDWLRYEGSTRGWVRVMPETAIDAANEGKPVIATPKQGVSKVALMAIVRPGPVGPGGHPRVAAASKTCGNDLNVQDALGVAAVEYFVHP